MRGSGDCVYECKYSEQNPVKSAGSVEALLAIGFFSSESCQVPHEQVNGGHSAVSLADPVFPAITECLRFAGLLGG